MLQVVVSEHWRRDSIGPTNPISHTKPHGSQPKPVFWGVYESRGALSGLLEGVSFLFGVQEG